MMAYGTSMSQAMGWDNRKPGLGLPPQRNMALQNALGNPATGGKEPTVPQMIPGQPVTPDTYRLAAMNRAFAPMQKLNPKYMDYDINKMR